MKKFNFIDLFAGCGGLSEGFYKSDYNSLAHVEIDKNCCSTLKERMKYYGYKDDVIENTVLQKDITSPDIIELLDKAVCKNSVDIIIGGPPCQAYSTAGRARDEDGMQHDPRNFLFEHYVKILNHFKPKLFVFENVTGLLTAKIAGKKIIEKVFAALSENFNISNSVESMLFNTSNYGVPQIRKRLIIIGVRKDLKLNIDDIYKSFSPTHFDPEMKINQPSLKQFVSVEDAIGDLPKIKSGCKLKEMEYENTSKIDNEFLRWVRTPNSRVIFDHVTRTNNKKDLERYSEMARNKWTYTQLLENRPDLDHKKKRVFNNSYVVQFSNLPSRTILAHLCKDGNQFIHPDYKQARSISVREAARLQSFPDDFRFSGSMCQQFKQIGNAVPPLFAKIIAENLKYWLEKTL